MLTAVLPVVAVEQIVRFYMQHTDDARRAGYLASLDAGEPFPDEFLAWLFALAGEGGKQTGAKEAKRRPGRPKRNKALGTVSEIRDKVIAWEVGRLLFEGASLRDPENKGGRGKYKAGAAAVPTVAKTFYVSDKTVEAAYQKWKGIHWGKSANDMRRQVGTIPMTGMRRATSEESARNRAAALRAMLAEWAPLWMPSQSFRIPIGEPNPAREHRVIDPDEFI